LYRQCVTPARGKGTRQSKTSGRGRSRRHADTGAESQALALRAEKRCQGRWILRFRMEAYDAKLLLGMVRQIVWKLQQADKR